MELVFGPLIDFRNEGNVFSADSRIFAWERLKAGFQGHAQPTRDQKLNAHVEVFYWRTRWTSMTIVFYGLCESTVIVQAISDTTSVGSIETLSYPTPS